MKMRFAGDCVGLSRRDAEELSEALYKARNITRKTFLSHVNTEDRTDLEILLGYAHRNSRAGLNIANDWHVGYITMKMYGRRVYAFIHSSIEYIFTPDGELRG